MLILKTGRALEAFLHGKNCEVQLKNTPNAFVAGQLSQIRNFGKSEEFFIRNS
jgi:hypothetical protein